MRRWLPGIRRASDLVRRVVLGGAGVALALYPEIAAADEPTEPPPAVAVHVGSIRPGMSVAIETNGDDAVAQVVSRCFEDCEEVLDPGPYRLRLLGPDGETLGTTNVNIKRPMAFHVVGGSRAAATTGLVLGISGIVVAGTGVAALGLAALSSMCEADNCGGDSVRWVGVYALVAIPVGAVVTSIGWAMFVRNRRLFRSEIVKTPKGHDDDEHDSALNLRVGIAPTPQGLTGALTLSF